MNRLLKENRMTVVWLAGLLLSMSIVLVLPAPDAAQGLSGYAPLHAIMEFAAASVAAMVFGICWVTQQFRANVRALVIGCAFLGVALLDIGHTLSFRGMPDFITENGAEKGIDFWLAARAMASLALLSVSLWPDHFLEQTSFRSRYLWLVASLMVVAMVYGVIFSVPELLPRTFSIEKGLTAFKVGFEYAVMAIHIVAALVFLLRGQRTDGVGAAQLALASFTMAMAEFFFTLYADVTDIYNVVGHLYKILGYVFLYKGLFVETVQRPYADLQEAQAQQQATLGTLPDLLFEVDEQGVYRAVFASEANLLARPQQELIGQNIRNILPPEAAATCLAAIAEARESGRSLGKQIELPLANNPSYFQLSVARKSALSGVGQTYLMLSRDVTEAVVAERQRLLDAQVNEAIIALEQLADTTQESDLLRAGIEHAERLTQSLISFIHFVHEDQETIELVTWSSTTLAQYCTATYDTHYPVSKAGIWTEAMRQMRPVVFNDYSTAPNKKGLPDGHAALQRLISLPVIQGGKVRMLLGVGNKPTPYTEWDVATLQKLADVTWNIAQNRRHQAVIHQLSEALDQSPNPVVITDARAKIQYVNRAFTQVSGYESKEVLGKNPRILQSGQTPAATYADLWKNLSQGLSWQGEFINHRKDGQVYIENAIVYPVHDQFKHITHFVAHKEDITAKKATEQRILALSQVDALTGLLNKNTFDDALNRLLDTAKNTQEQVYLLWIDLDNFRVVNESMGHSAGDELLAAFGNRLRSALEPHSVIARYSGDVFAATIQKQDQASVTLIVKRLLHQLQEPMAIYDTPLAISASVGVAVFPEDGKDASSMCAAAEVAMHRVKQEGRNGLRFFSSALQEHSQRSLELAMALPTAIENQELFVVFQPQQEIESGKLCGAEALVRWQHPKLGLIPPAEFIPLAEQTGTVSAIGSWVLEQAAKQALMLEKKGVDGVVIAVNVSAVQFDRPEWLDEMLTVIQRVGVSPHRIEFELTEAVAVRYPLQAGTTIERLHSAGFKVSLDDFGTGYSSLSYLRRYAIDKLKIDQSFIRGIERNPESREIVQAIVRMAHGLRMTTIAEGVETASELDWVRQLGCDEIQGYLYAKPMSADAFMAWVMSCPR